MFLSEINYIIAKFHCQVLVLSYRYIIAYTVRFYPKLIQDCRARYSRSRISNAFSNRMGELVFFILKHIQPVILPLLFKQLLVTALLDDLSLAEIDYLIRVLYGG